jgi:hypothetical protein
VLTNSLPLTEASSEEQLALFSRVIDEAVARQIQFAVGGSLAMAGYGGGLLRTPKDLDLYIAPEDKEQLIQVLNDLGFADYHEKQPYDRNWIYRATRQDVLVDVIWQMANGRAKVDAAWLLRGPLIRWVGNDLRLVAIEELIWSKLYVLQRDRCDWPDICNLIDAARTQIDWPRLFDRVGPDAPLLDAVLKVYSWLRPDPARAGAAGQSDTSRRAALLDSRPWLLSEQHSQNRLLSEQDSQNNLLDGPHSPEKQ